MHTNYQTCVTKSMTILLCLKNNQLVHRKISTGINLSYSYFYTHTYPQKMWISILTVAIKNCLFFIKNRLFK